MYEGKVKNIELLLVNRLDFNRDNQICLDSIRMFYDALRCREEYPDKFFKKLDYEYLLKNSLKDIHDKLSLITRDDKIAMKYKEYNIEKDLPIFEKEIEGYQFLMPRNSAEIIRLADIMHNCVASYDDKMANGSSKIVYACNNQDVINYIKTGEGDYEQEVISLQPLPGHLQLINRGWQDDGRLIGVHQKLVGHISGN